ncbi:MAG: methionine adenosyltransferase [Elusimicrobia bacterium RIFOXYA2_FULL_39_19]|nr:MAG: methionine adenosyltransferase [Elusimicrobia bacterium RIFOXYA2_FULL_39_19]
MSFIRKDFFFTSESVGAGHPDKVCDKISDGILDEVLRQDPRGRVACETFVTLGLVIVGGEITTKAYVDVQGLVKKTIKAIGYTDPKYGFDYKTCGILNGIHAQSPDISMGVDTGGAGDQGIMIGYANNETKELMPMPITLAHKLIERVDLMRTSGQLPYLGPDCKSQVTVEYVKGKPARVDAVVVACQHTEEVLDKSGKYMAESAKKQMLKEIINPIIGKLADSKTKYFINATGKFVIGGPASDTGMTGRKIIVDTYGGWAQHGGGAFSGKDPTKVDRSATYMARHIAKNIVAANLADECTVELSYCIGVADPVSIMVDTHNTGEISDERLEKIVRDVFPLTPRGIIDYLKLLRPIYGKTAAGGHFGRKDADFLWEKTNKADELKRATR